MTAGMVVGAGAAGLIGLLAGRWLADRAGRRLTGALAMVAVALFATLTYTGSAAALLAGYILSVHYRAFWNRLENFSRAT